MISLYIFLYLGSKMLSSSVECGRNAETPASGNSGNTSVPGSPEGSLAEIFEFNGSHVLPSLSSFAPVTTSETSLPVDKHCRLTHTGRPPEPGKGDGHDMIAEGNNNPDLALQTMQQASAKTFRQSQRR